MRGIFQKEDGLAAVEFALIAPILIVMLIGMIDFGTFINQRMQMQNVARAAGEYILRGGEDANVMEDVVTLSLELEEEEEEDLETESARICECEDGEEIACDDACPDGEYRRQYYTFSMTRSFSPIFPYPGIAEEIPITGSVRIQIE